ncbi:MAG: pentapeptide repeat-containing protein [Bacteroidales bacterium]|nr:pentapeptide repeat-containing protein [Bacteroidales bacterium]
MEKKKKTFLFIDKSNNKNKRFNYKYLFLITVLGFILLAVTLFCFDMHTIMYGDSQSAVGQYIMSVVTVLGGALVGVGLWINNRRVLEQTRQNNIAEKAQINTRFKDAATLLGSENVSSILSGIYALHQIAMETSDGNDTQKGYVSVIHDILCAFIRENTDTIHDEVKGRDWRINKKPPIVIQTILKVLFTNEKQIYKELIADLSYCVFEYINLEEAAFTGVDFSKTKFIKSTFKKSVFESCFMEEAFIDEVDFSGCDFRKIVFDNSLIRKTTFENALLADCDFWHTQQNSVSYKNAGFKNVDFKNSVFENKMNFDETPFKNLSHEQIITDALSLTKEK